MNARMTWTGAAVAVLALCANVGAQLGGQTAGIRDDAGLPTLPKPVEVVETDDGLIFASDLSGTEIFTSWTEYGLSDFFIRNGMKCGVTPALDDGKLYGTAGDCTNSFTNPAAEYDPAGNATYNIPVVVHVIHRTNGTGNISDALIDSQIDVLNEDFQALAGSLGQNGYDASITFTLAGVTRTASNQWYNDSSGYWNALAWDTNQYLNIYTNTASGNLGYAYVPNGGGVVGNIADRVVIFWAAFGRNAPYGPPYDLGRTVTHEVGHYLGLYHTFDGGCTSPSNCNGNGDLICDTNPESSPMYSGACSRTTCSSPDPADNYMDYSDDLCMQRFTVEQVRRMRCTIENWRVDLAGGTGPALPGQAGSPNPADGATGVSTGATLSWSPGSGADAYDVYLGTDATPDAGEFAGNQTGTSFDPGGLAASTTYYWRVDSVNTAGTTTGAVWSFTTAGGGSGGITLSVNAYKDKGRWTTDLSWSGATGGTVEIHRDGALLTTTANDGAYTDATTFKGGGSLTYQVCESGGSPCSNSATANF